MSNHTPEPWYFGGVIHPDTTLGHDEPISPWIIGSGPRRVSNGREQFIYAPDMARAVSCVNAMTGIPNPATEMARLRAVEAALTRIASMPTSRLSPDVTASFLQEAISLARAAKVGGGA